jgi:hypothetical protein
MRDTQGAKSGCANVDEGLNALRLEMEKRAYPEMRGAAAPM